MDNIGRLHSIIYVQSNSTLYGILLDEGLDGFQEKIIFGVANNSGPGDYRFLVSCFGQAGFRPLREYGEGCIKVAQYIDREIDIPEALGLKGKIDPPE